MLILRNAHQSWTDGARLGRAKTLPKLEEGDPSIERHERMPLSCCCDAPDSWISWKACDESSNE